MARTLRSVEQWGDDEVIVDDTDDAAANEKNGDGSGGGGGSAGKAASYNADKAAALRAMRDQQRSERRGRVGNTPVRGEGLVVVVVVAAAVR